MNSPDQHPPNGKVPQRANPDQIETHRRFQDAMARALESVKMIDIQLARLEAERTKRIVTIFMSEFMTYSLEKGLRNAVVVIRSKLAEANVDPKVRGQIDEIFTEFIKGLSALDNTQG